MCLGLDEFIEKYKDTFEAMYPGFTIYVPPRHPMMEDFTYCPRLCVRCPDGKPFKLRSHTFDEVIAEMEYFFTRHPELRPVNESLP